ncbi:hypothetical protein COO09_15910 [Rhizorhabdus dicambivorans]|uniref:Uncharacterized protein n=1 Tax=Rhizorhabdus dicambivorans TaxID=1850238 RepID=A0A2A4FRF6_9SPHN|nr:hypothetical protein CMV14_10170 [Rhizorhabdus dicambivorans]PCE41335.1 hypothetical protein COO09_15910 [Rhizorhabdus dicambivorans]
MDQAIIVHARIVAGHGGSAELLVRLRHGNGVESSIVLNEETGLRLMRNCGASHVDDLAGQSWRWIVQDDCGPDAGE